MKHKKTNQWIIGHNKNDSNAKYVDNFSDGLE